MSEISSGFCSKCSSTTYFTRKWNHYLASTKFYNVFCISTLFRKNGNICCTTRFIVKFGLPQIWKCSTYVHTYVHTQGSKDVRLVEKLICS